MAAGKLDLVIEKGATFQKTLYYKDKTKVAIDLTGYTARMQIRETPQSSTFVAELTTENGGITITGAAGQIDLLLSATATSAISVDSGNYDLELESPGGVVTKLVRGHVSIIEEITK